MNKIHWSRCRRTGWKMILVFASAASLTLIATGSASGIDEAGTWHSGSFVRDGRDRHDELHRRNKSIRAGSGKPGQ